MTFATFRRYVLVDTILSTTFYINDSIPLDLRSQGATAFEPAGFLEGFRLLNAARSLGGGAAAHLRALRRVGGAGAAEAAAAELFVGRVTTVGR